jgi:hypothetical protein
VYVCFLNSGRIHDKQEKPEVPCGASLFNLQLWEFRLPRIDADYPLPTQLKKVAAIFLIIT